MLTTREIIKTLYNAFNQKLKNHRGNWEQNDPTADDYIKNRPFYIDENNVIEIIPKQTAVFNSVGDPASAIGVAIISLSPIIKLVVGQEYDVVWDGMKYKCIAYELEGLAVIGSNFFTNNSFDDEPFLISIDKEMFGGAYIVTGDINSHVIEVTTKDIKKLDKKYLPDFAPVATSGSYNDLTDTPTIYSDVVRYGASQNLTTAQENQARNNIGAASSLEVAVTVKYNGVQNLTSAQKLQARTNIGAGTSNFSGSYNDLTNKPTIHDVDATLSVEGDAADAKAVGDAVMQLTEQKADRSELEKLNTPKESIFFIDQINGYRYIACMRDGNFITYCAIKNIEITSMPSKIEYIAGDHFDPTGMVVSAVAYDGTTKEIVDYTLPESYLTNGTTYVEISYIEAGLIYTANVPITVNEFDPAVVLVDFEYTANDNGTYTITGWKGTYNGESSTEMIIPNNGLIIV